MKITRMSPFNGNGKTKAFFDLQVQEGIVIKGFSLVEGQNGLFVNCLSEKGKDGKYYDKVVLSKELKDELTKLALEEYERKK
jgi:stage V sporulation protein G